MKFDGKKKDFKCNMRKNKVGLLKIIRVTTHDISLNGLLEEQLKFLSQYYDVVGVAKDTGELDLVRQREGVRCIDVPMEREIAIGKDIKALGILYRLFK